VPPPGVTGSTRLSLPKSASAEGATVSASAKGGNVNALADAIFTLLDNRDAAAAMGRRGREIAEIRFGWTDYLTRLYKIYERVIESRRSH